MAMIRVRIPNRNTEFFNLYANGNVVDAWKDDELGTFFVMEGVVVLQYTYPSRRRAYIVCETRDAPLLGKPEGLPCVDAKCAVLDEITGSKVDRLRRALWHLERIAGKDVYALPPAFWQRVSLSLVYTGKGTSGKSRMRRLLEAYAEKEQK